MFFEGERRISFNQVMKCCCKDAIVDIVQCITINLLRKNVHSSVTAVLAFPLGFGNHQSLLLIQFFLCVHCEMIHSQI